MRLPSAFVPVSFLLYFLHFAYLSAFLPLFLCSFVPLFLPSFPAEDSLALLAFFVFLKHSKYMRIIFLLSRTDNLHCV